MKNYRLFAFIPICLVFVLNLSTGYGQANGCESILAERSGTVLPAGPARVTVTPNTDQVVIEVTKNPSGAETLAKIYVDDVLKSTLSFPNGVTYARTERYTATNVNGKEVKVVISNSSVGLKSDYICKIIGITTSLAPGSEPVTGNLSGQTQKSVELSPACRDQVRIIVRRTSGQAVGNIFVYIGNSSQPFQSHVLGKDEDQKVFVLTGSTNRRYRVVLKNQSIGNFLGYSINGIQL